jgi:hypothetical protein
LAINGENEYNTRAPNHMASGILKRSAKIMESYALPSNNSVDESIIISYL